MRAKVTARGLWIPKRLLEGIREVEIIKEQKNIVIVPVPTDDPILQLGKSPVTVPEDDAAENHDRYIYQR
jgi:hypothetical protein